MDHRYINASTWMRDSLHLIGHKSLFNLVLPGTHDSAAYEFSDDYMPGSQKKSVQFWINLTDGLIKNLIKNIEITQTLDVYHQLKRGARYLDIRAGWYKKKWYTYHCHVGPTLKKVLTDISKFLNKYECEVVIIEISHFRNHNQESIEKLKLLIQKHLSKFLCHLDPSTEFPIFNLISSNRRAIVMLPKGHDKKLFIWSDKALKNSYPNKNKLSEIRLYNESRISNIPQNKLLKISWILTPGGSDLKKNLLKLAKDVNIEKLKSFSKYFKKQNKSNIEAEDQEKFVAASQILNEKLYVEEEKKIEIIEKPANPDSSQGKLEDSQILPPDQNIQLSDEESESEEQVLAQESSLETHSDPVPASVSVSLKPPGRSGIEGTIILIDNFGQSSIMHLIYKLNNLIK